AHLKRALAAYCAGTNAKSNEAQVKAPFIGHTFCDGPTYEPCAEFPETPGAGKKAVRLPEQQHRLYRP
ncbi:hypothetical protein LPJ60_006311, partial [Coemansia sp. RSA 2675]